MTPEKKAKELVDKFLVKITMDMAFPNNSAKDAALIAVEEVLFVIGKEIAFEHPQRHETRAFWESVKEEINKL